jgi:hypothetical protein
LLLPDTSGVRRVVLARRKTICVPLMYVILDRYITLVNLVECQQRETASDVYSQGGTFCFLILLVCGAVVLARREYSNRVPMHLVYRFGTYILVDLVEC